MTDYRRRYIPRATYFFTVVTYDREKILTLEYARICLRKAFEFALNKCPFQVEAMVLLPDHILIMWKLLEDDKDYSTRWRLIKSKFTQMYNQNKTIQKSFSQSRLKKKEQGI